jgi:putative Ca2+/H+ antiporter (TMEM165/GDT1 family)
MVDEIMKQKSKRTSSMILGVDESDIQNTEENNEDKDKYNLTNVNVVNEKKYVPDIKKELTIIPEDDISREDSIIDNTTMLLSAKKQKNNNDDNDNEFILGNKNSGGIFNLKLRKTKPQTSEKKSSIDNTNNTNNNIITSEFKNNDEKNEKITSEENNEENNGENTDEKLNEKKIKYKSRYYLDYVDKDVDTDKPNIDTTVFSTIFFSICLSEFGDRTQLISLSSASIFHFWGSLLGSCTALFCSCLIGVYFSKPIVKKLKQKFVDFILGILFLITGIQIYIFKLNNKNTI